MKSIKKILTFILLLSIILTHSIPASGKSDLILNGKVNMNLDTNGNKMLENLQDATLKLKNLVIAGNNSIQLNGNVSYEKAQLPIQLKGFLGRSSLDENTLIGNVEDRAGNFQIIYLSINSNINNKGLLFDKSLENEKVLTLLMLRKDTREFFMFQTNLSKIDEEFKSNISINYKIEKLNENVVDEHWWVKVFEPVKIQRDIMSIGHFVQPADITQTYRYNLYSGYYDYNMKLRVFANIFDATTGQKITDSAGLSVVQEWITDDRGNTINSSDSYLQIKNCVGAATLYTPNSYDYAYKFYDKILSLNWGQLYTENVGGLTIAPGLWIGQYIFGLGISYSPYSTSINVDGVQAFSGTENIKSAKVTFSKALTAVNDKYSLQVEKYRDQSFYSPKMTIFHFNFDVFFQGGGKVGTGSAQASTYYD